MFTISALSQYDADNCYIGGKKTDKHADFDTYVTAIKLIIVATTSAGLGLIVFGGIYESFKYRAYFFGSVLLHGTVVSLFMGLYALTTADCDVTHPITPRKDNNVTYVAIFLTVIFVSLGLSNIPFHSASLSNIEEGKTDRSYIKMADAILRLVALALAMEHLVDKHGVFINTDVTDTTELATMNTVCTDALESIRNRTAGNAMVAYDASITDNLITSALSLTAAELLFRIIEQIYVLMHGQSGLDSAYVRIGLGFRYLMTVASHVLIGVIIAAIVQLSMYDECEAYEKTSAFRTTMGLLFASLFSSVLHLQTLDIEHKVKNGEVMDSGGSGSFMNPMFGF